MQHPLLLSLLLALLPISPLAEGGAGAIENEEQQQCTLGAGESCAGEGEGELSSLLQQQRRLEGHAPAQRKECPIPSMALDALKTGLNDILEHYVTDVHAEIPELQKAFDVHNCTVKTFLKGHLNIAGLSGLKIRGFDCGASDCLDSTWGICTKTRAGFQVTLRAPEFSIAGSGNAKLSFEGECATLMDQLPTIPSFDTKIHIAKPKLTVELGADFQLFPPDITNAAFAVTVFNYDSVDEFRCGIDVGEVPEWFPDVNGLCDEYLSKILDDAKSTVGTMLNSQGSVLKSDIESAAARTQVHKE